ncbi:MAG: MipA/OmpV family protein [Paraglaciecola sp.]|uniref:MipA/OmpV family protein n=1 Tax=Paraglaciecola sp. TaxID=1920173 RepID=UPI003264F405
MCFAATAKADDPLTLNPVSAWYGLNFESGWHFDFEVGLEYEPTYAGSDKYLFEGGLGARALYSTKSGHRYFVSLGEIGAVFSLSPDTQFLAFVEYEEERNDDEDSTLAGMNTINSTIEGQFMLATRFGNATLFGVLQPDLAGDANKGLVWFVGTGYDWLSNDKRWRTSTTLDLSGADSEYMLTEFGIASEESTRTGYLSYQPSSGLKSLSWNVAGEYYFSDNFSLLGSVDTEYYLSEASDSPLIADEGREITFEASLQLRYRY